MNLKYKEKNMSNLELPEVFKQTQPREGVSNRYQMINTESVIKDLVNKYSFKLDDIKVAGVRKTENIDKQKHLAILKYTDLQTEEGVPTLVIANSHNRSSSFQVHTGYIRFACENGLIAGTNIESMKVQHTAQNWNELLSSFISQYMKNVSIMEDEHRLLKRKQLNNITLKYFLEEASKIRYDLKDVLDINELNLIRRPEDVGSDMYKTYNRVQESLIKGLFTRRTRRTTDDGIVLDNWSQAKMLTDQKEIIRVNKEIRDLAIGLTA